MLRAFAGDPESANQQYEGQPIRIVGRITNIEPALLGDTLIELEGGRVSILVNSDAIDDLQDRMVKSELAAAKGRITAFTQYAEENDIPAAERRKRAVDALPTAELTANLIGFRNGKVKMRNGRKVTFKPGQDLVP